MPDEEGEGIHQDTFLVRRDAQGKFAAFHLHYKIKPTRKGWALICQARSAEEAVRIAEALDRKH